MSTMAVKIKHTKLVAVSEQQQRSKSRQKTSLLRRTGHGAAARGTECEKPMCLPGRARIMFFWFSQDCRGSLGEFFPAAIPLWTHVAARKCPDYVLLVSAGMSLVTRAISERRQCDRQDGGSKQTVPQRKSAPRHSQTAPLIKAIMSPTMACNRRAILFENTSTVGEPLRRVLDTRSCGRNIN